MRGIDQITDYFGISLSTLYLNAEAFNAMMRFSKFVVIVALF
jgi:hypothetical protein